MKLLRNILAALAFTCAACTAQAVEVQDGMHKKCTTSDAWKGPDKTKHALVGAGIGYGVTIVTEKAEYGVLATVLVAGLKEAYDRRGYGTCSFQDFAVTVAAGVAASYGTKWVIVPMLNKNGQPDGALVTYNTKF